MLTPLYSALASLPMAEVKFPAYRQYLEQRQMVNSAVMALLAGSQLAMNTLQLVEGSDRTMTEIFPRVPHIERFNLKTEQAGALLNDAEAHLSAMAIPYIFTIHESLFETFESMLTASGIRVPRKKQNTSPVWIVKNYWQDAGRQLEESSWLVYKLLAELRHDIIHRAGVIGQKLVDAAGAMSPEAISLWERMAGKPFPSFVLRDKHVLDHADMVVCLAVVKFLAKEGNELMQICYPRKLWLRDFVQDVNATRRLVGNPAQKARKARSFARQNYVPLNFELSEIGQEIKVQGNEEAGRERTRPAQ